MALCVPASAVAASFEFGLPVRITQISLPRSEADFVVMPVTVGDTIRVPVYINLEEDSVVVVDMRIHFSRDLLWVKSFTVASGWLAVSGHEYNYLDNGRGIVRATAGFEEGVAAFVDVEQNSRVLFGTLEFVSVGSGITEVRALRGSSILDAENKDILTGVETGKARFPISNLPQDGNAPPQLFDIRLEMAKTTLMPGEPITARIFFQSFGTVPTPVDIFFLVLDETGKIYASSEEAAVVETEAVLTKQFEQLDLPPGNYTLHVDTRYDTNIEDEFEATFSVRSAFSPWFIAGGLAGVLSLAVFALLIINRQKRKHGTK